MRGEDAPDESFCEAVVDLVLAGAMGVAEMRRPRVKTA
jgi:hypothetical protein